MKKFKSIKQGEPFFDQVLKLFIKYLNNTLIKYLYNI